MVGDDLLVSIARRLEGCVRAGDTVARLGGDEFAVLLAEVSDVRDATRVAERILVELSVPFRLAGQEVYMDGEHWHRTQLHRLRAGRRRSCAMPTPPCTGRSWTSAHATRSSIRRCTSWC
jgi:GGDEF domain-containing protein